MLYLTFDFEPNFFKYLLITSKQEFDYRNIGKQKSQPHFYQNFVFMFTNLLKNEAELSTGKKATYGKHLLRA